MSGNRERAALVGALLAVTLSLAACSASTRADSSGAPSGGSIDSSDSASTPTGLPSTAVIAPPKPRLTTASPSPTHPAAKPEPTTTSSKAPVTGSAPPKVTYVFPVSGKVGYAHAHHDYPASDMITACGNTIRAVTSGVILGVTRVDTWKASVNAGATRGGLSYSIRGDDGVRYYGSHLEQINTNIKPGVRVTAGQSIGKIGRTGDAGACHMHFGISPICRGTGDWWIQRGVIYPWPYLDSWRKGGSKSPLTTVNAWQKQHGCPSKPLVDP